MNNIGGIPVVEKADEILWRLVQMGIKPWPRVKLLSMKDYLSLNLSPEKMNAVKRFAPKLEVVILGQPNNGKPFDGFRVAAEDGVIVFTVLNEMVLVVADYVHGGEIIRIKPPAGAYKEEEGVPAITRALAELREETRLVVKDTDLTLLSRGPGIYDEPRRLTSKEIYFLAKPEPPFTILPPKPDSTEILQPFLVPFKEWLKSIKTGIVLDSSAITATMLYCLKTGKL